MADQSAAFYGSCCFFPGDVKLTLGTGAFLDINVGSTPIVSKRGNKNRVIVSTHNFICFSIVIFFRVLSADKLEI